MSPAAAAPRKAAPPQSTPKPSREVQIVVLDKFGDAAQGAQVRFSASGAPLGVAVVGKDGARIRLPNRIAMLDISVEYGEQQQNTQLSPDQQEYICRFDVSLLQKSYGPPIARCPDGTTGQPCVDCKIGDDVIRICA
jgi:hypothetical protein